MKSHYVDVLKEDMMVILNRLEVKMIQDLLRESNSDTPEIEKLKKKFAWRNISRYP